MVEASTAEMCPGLEEVLDRQRKERRAEVISWAMFQEEVVRDREQDVQEILRCCEDERQTLYVDPKEKGISEVELEPKPLATYAELRRRFMEKYGEAGVRNYEREQHMDFRV